MNEKMQLRVCVVFSLSRLNNPFECPHNGSRRQDCACRNDHRAMGYTLFHRVRLDLSTMRIISKYAVSGMVISS